MKHFIFGYGSLICPQSRAITAPTLSSFAEPVIIHNLERTWSARVFREASSSGSSIRDHIEGYTPVGVRLRKGARCNGVLIHVGEEELKRFDIRESGYVRHKIDVGDIQPHMETDELIEEEMPLWPNSGHDEGDLHSFAMKRVQCPNCRVVFQEGFEKRRQQSVSGKTANEHLSESSMDVLNVNDSLSEIAVWVYIQSEDLPASINFPITQSYLDIIIRGCLSVSLDFARRFLETTDGWLHDGKSTDEHATTDHHTWINDRHDPVYVRADSEYSSEHGDRIDRLIEEHHPEAFKRRVICM
jgi:hypothetical protein